MGHPYVGYLAKETTDEDESQTAREDKNEPTVDLENQQNQP